MNDFFAMNRVLLRSSLLMQIDHEDVFNSGIFFVRFQKTQGQPQKNSRPILGKKLNLLEVVKNFNRKTQEIV